MDEHSMSRTSDILFIRQLFWTDQSLDSDEFISVHFLASFSPFIYKAVLEPQVSPSFRDHLLS